MGGAATFGTAFAKAQIAAGQKLPLDGAAFISVNNDDKPNVVPIARDLAALGFKLVATRGTAAYLRAHGLEVEVVYKINEGRPHVGDRIVNKQIQLVLNTPLGRESFFDDRSVRRVAMMQGVPCITTLTGGAATVSAIRALREQGLDVRSLQEYHGTVTTTAVCAEPTPIANGDGTGSRARPIPWTAVAVRPGRPSPRRDHGTRLVGRFLPLLPGGAVAGTAHRSAASLRVFVNPSKM